jgi:molecular chaperone Hsp33
MSPPPDLLVRAIAPAEDLRIVAALTTDVVKEAARRHGLVGPTSVAIGRALTSGLLLATMTKGDERVTLQLAGDGPLGGVVADANSAGEARAYVRHPDLKAPAAVGKRPLIGTLLGSGVLNVVRDLGLRELYQGQVELASGEIDEDVEQYLKTSEQVVSAIACDVVLADDGAVVRAGGVLVQALPGAHSDVVRDAATRLRQGALFELLADGDPGARELAAQLSPVHPIEFLADRPVRFQCRCSRERIVDTMRLLSTKELDEMIAEDKAAEVTCNFCSARYAVSVDELRSIRDEVARTREPN